MPTIPESHLESAQQLQADAYIDLFRIDLYPTGSVYLSSSRTVTWQGNDYDAIGMKLSGVGSYADEQQARPRFQVANPDALFSPFISQGALAQAKLTRIRVLRTDLEADSNVYVSQTWRIGRVAERNRTYVMLELRDLTDNPNFVIPANTFSPPNFPVVSIR